MPKTSALSNLVISGLALAACALLGGSAQAGPPMVTAAPGRPSLPLGAFDLPSMGYVVEEYFVSGTATSYRLVGTATADGRWQVKPAERAPYTTRLVVVRPKDAGRFNGSAVVEWLNVSGGYDVPADWLMEHRELMRGGYAYVGVTTQRVGVEGGAEFPRGNLALKRSDPARYGRLNHPGDAFSFDIYSQAAAVVRGAAGVRVLGPLVPKRVLSLGESQSAVFMTTYIDAIDPLAKAYDGFLVHSRFGTGGSLDGASIFAPEDPRMPAGLRFRTDLRAPVLTVITETDLWGPKRTGYYLARQPDNARLRVWEVPGTAHADNYTFIVSPADSGQVPPEKLAALYAPTATLMGATLEKPMNSAPQHHYVTEAALRRLDEWVRSGQAPPHGEPMVTRAGAKAGEHFSFETDANGEVRGGIRTPWVDVPVARLSGLPNKGADWGFLAGSTEPYSAEKLQQLYPGGREEYLHKFDASLTSAVKAGFILQDDVAEIHGLAAASFPAEDQPKR